MGACGVLSTALYLPQPRQFPMNFDTFPPFLVPLNQLHLLFLSEKYSPPSLRWSPYFIQHLMAFLQGMSLPTPV